MLPRPLRPRFCLSRITVESLVSSFMYLHRTSSSVVTEEVYLLLAGAIP